MSKIHTPAELLGRDAHGLCAAGTTAAISYPSISLLTSLKALLVPVLVYDAALWTFYAILAALLICSEWAITRGVLFATRDGRHDVVNLLVCTSFWPKESWGCAKISFLTLPYLLSYSIYAIISILLASTEGEILISIHMISNTEACSTSVGLYMSAS